MEPIHVRHRGAGAARADGKPGDVFLPTTFLLDEGHVVRWVYRPETYRVRAPASEVLRQIDALGRPPAVGALPSRRRGAAGAPAT